MKSIKYHCKNNHEKMSIKTKSSNSGKIAEFRGKQKLQQNNRGEIFDRKNQAKNNHNVKNDVADNDEEGKLDTHGKVKQ